MGESKRSDERAQEEFSWQSAALQAAANAIVITDRQGIIQWVNRAFEQLTGYGAAEVTGQTPRLLKSGRHGLGFYQEMWATILAGRVWHGELVNRRKDGSLYHEEMTVTPIRDEPGKVTHFIGIKQDVSERKRAEEALRQARDELARANADLERKVQERNAQLVEANANLRTFTSTAAHDLRSPLRAIKCFSSIVLGDYGTQLGPEAQSLLERVIESADQTTQLLDDMLECSQLAQAELRLDRLSLRTAAAEALALLEADIRRKNALVTVDDRLPEAIGHPATVVLLIENLVSNALKFVAPGVQPQIRISAEASGDCARLSVQDNGIGIGKADQEKIFDAFQRLHAKQAYPGTGLGLTIVRKGAERMGGRAGVESEPGQGSRFWVELKAVGPTNAPPP